MKNAVFFLMCFLYFPNGVLFGADWGKRNKVTLKIGENVTLQFPVNDSAAGEITDVKWTKEYAIFLEISKDKVHFPDEVYKSIICSYNISSITICNAARNNTGLYTAHIKYSKAPKHPKIEPFYVAEHPYFCDGTTYRNEIEGDNATLSIVKYPSKEFWWSKNNINVTDSENPKLSVNDIGTLSIPNVRKEDEGNYTVTIVKKDLQLYPACNHTYILSISRSGFCGKATNRNKIEGDDVNLPGKVCKSAESCRWSKNNTNVTSSENPKVSIYDIGTLSIHNVTKEDDGNYTVIKEGTQCSYTYILSISSAAIKDGTPSTQNRSRGAVIGAVIVIAVIAVIAGIYVRRKKTRQRKTRRKRQPVPLEEIQLQDHQPVPLEERQLQDSRPGAPEEIKLEEIEMIRLNSNSHPNGVCENEEETAT